MSEFNGRGRGFGGPRGGRGDFNQDSEGGGGGRGSYGGAGRGTFPSRGDFNQDSEAPRGGGFTRGGGRGNFNQDSEGGGFSGRGNFNQGSEGGRGGYSTRGTFNQGSEAGENSRGGGFGGGRGGRGDFNQASESGRGSYGGRGRGNQDSEGQNTRGNYGGGRGGGFNQDSEGGGRGSYGGGRGGFSGRGDFNQGSDAGDNSRGGGFGGGRGARGNFNQDSEGGRGGGFNGRGGGRGGYNQNNEGGENQRGGYSGRGRGDFNQDSDSGRGGGFNGRGGGRGNFNQDSEGGGFRGGRGNFNQDSEGGGFRGGRGNFNQGSEGGRGGFSGRGDFNQGSEAGENNRGGGFGGPRGRGGYNQDRNYGDQENQGGPGRGGFTQSRTGADAPAGEGLEGEVPQPQRAPMNFVPVVRDLDQIYQEDVESAAAYSQVTDFDDDVIVENSKCEVVRIQNWDEADFDPKIIENVKVRSKYTRPRKIQGATIPFILDHFDIKAQAETGSGKTAAFLLPIIDSCIKAKKSQGTNPYESELAAPYAVIIGPTRELVLQVYEQAQKFANGTGVTVAKAYGQYNINRNHEEIRQGCDILVATVGRLKHFVMNEDIFVHKIRYLVLDEADRLLDSNFAEDIEAITNHPLFPSKEKRGTMLFSATFDNSVMAVADRMLKPDAVFITNHRNDPNKKIKQDFIVVDHSKSRLDILKDLLKDELEKVGASEKMRRTLVFVNTKRFSDMAALYLCQHGVPATSINGDRGQNLREQALSDFRNHVVSVLVSTDVTARGIDVKHLDHVINFDLPTDAITYTHRIGRTGRITQGFATTFVEGNEPILHEIAESLKKIGPLPESLEKAMKRDFGGHGDAGGASNYTPAAAPPPSFAREPSSGNNGPAQVALNNDDDW